MMRLTQKLALKITLELWTWLAETGRKKGRWPGWKEYGGIRAFYEGCAFCEYKRRTVGFARCLRACPYATFFDEECHRYFDQWNDAKTPKARKVAAQACVDQLRKMLS